MAQGMTVEQAQKIIAAYGSALGAAPPGTVARPKSLLPCSAARIKYAFFVYLEALVNQNALHDAIATNLIVSYTALKQFIDDKRADELNRVVAELRASASGQGGAGQPQLGEIMKEVSALFDNLEGMEEINAFIAECSRNRGAP